MPIDNNNVGLGFGEEPEEVGFGQRSKPLESPPRKASRVVLDDDDEQSTVGASAPPVGSTGGYSEPQRTSTAYDDYEDENENERLSGGQYRCPNCQNKVDSWGESCGVCKAWHGWYLFEQIALAAFWVVVLGGLGLGLFARDYLQHPVDKFESRMRRDVAGVQYVVPKNIKGTETLVTVICQNQEIGDIEQLRQAGLSFTKYAQIIASEYAYVGAEIMNCADGTTIPDSGRQIDIRQALLYPQTGDWSAYEQTWGGY